MNKICLAVAAAALLWACSPVRALNVLTPNGAFDRVAAVSYGDNPRQMLDLYSSISPNGHGPVIVFLYGGGWTAGERANYKFAAEAFTSEGYDVVVPDYRLWPDARFPDFVEDAAAAVAWTHGAFPDRPIVLIGHSAGAYNAMMVALDPAFLAAHGVNRCGVLAGAVGLSGPYGMTPVEGEPYTDIFPGLMKGRDAPINLADGVSPPILLISGEKDRTVGFDNTTALAARLAEAGSQVRALAFPSLNHVDTVRMLSTYFADNAGVKAQILFFLDEVSRRSAPFCEGAQTGGPTEPSG